MKNVSSVLVLAVAGVVLVALSASAAPSHHQHLVQRNNNQNSIHDEIQKAWSALELFIYRLLHGGKYPPGYGASPSSSSAAPSSTKVSSTRSSTAVVSTTSIQSTTTVISSSATSSSSSSAAPTSTTSSSTSTSTISSVAAPSSSASIGQSVCAVQPPSLYAPSCSITSDDTCCNTQQGHLLLTQFFDVGASSTGPADSWTVHGLWPDKCDGSYDSYCNVAQELTNITSVLESYGQTDLLTYMSTYWKDYSGDDETFWEHEFNKHATCISTIQPSCFVDYYPQADAVVFFNKAVDLFKTLPSYEWLAEAGIVPSLTQTYTLDQISTVLEAKHGGAVNVNCASGGVLDELWYHFNSRGSIIDGDFVPAALVGSGSTCPTTGIKYYPKYTTIPTTTTSASGSGATSTGKGFIYAVEADGTIPSKTCLISGGTWYYGGTCAGYTLGQVTGGAVTLKSSKGLCAVDATGVFGCSSAVTQASEFVMASDGTLNLGGSTAFSADHVPSGSEQVAISKGTAQTLPLTLKYVAQ